MPRLKQDPVGEHYICPEVNMMETIRIIQVQLNRLQEDDPGEYLKDVNSAINLFDAMLDRLWSHLNTVVLDTRSKYYREVEWLRRHRAAELQERISNKRKWLPVM